MGIVELFVLAVGLSADAFAVSVGKGLSMRKLAWGQALLVATFFGGFQALMPALGWALGEQFDRYVTAVEGWLAFGLLAFVGAKMLWDAFHEDGQPARDVPLRIRELLLLAIATSIDAFAAGVALALVDADILLSSALIGLTTFFLSLAGVAIGHVFGARWSRPSTIAGGAVLIVIGLKTLLDSLL